MIVTNWKEWLHGPIITSLLDADFYKFTMGSMVLRRHPDVHVRYGFTNRTKRVRLADAIDVVELREQLGHVRTLRFRRSELSFLNGIYEYERRMFPDAYAPYLAGLQLPDYELGVENGQFVLEFPGPWPAAIYWETLALSIVQELYSRALLRNISRSGRDAVIGEGVKRLAEKVRILKQYPDVSIVDFGTRRRFSLAWQRYVNSVLAEELPGQFRGTSNTRIAMEQDLMPMGTNAHELAMVYAAIGDQSDAGLRQSQSQVYRDWWEEYGYGLSIALPDTFGTENFFRHAHPALAYGWKGVRQDSGDPIAFTDRALAFYDRHAVNPREHMVVYSDGLDLDCILRVHAYLQVLSKTRPVFKASYGWGTGLTNDLGLPNLSIVVKAIEASGSRTVKLSDNPAKATGSPDDIAHYMRAFGHTEGAYVECRV